MKAWLLRRLLLIIPSLIGISLITFVMLQLMPGSPVSLRLQKLQGTMAATGVSPEMVEQRKKLYGLDKPVWKQYLLWVGRMCTLDFGTSYIDRRPLCATRFSTRCRLPFRST